MKKIEIITESVLDKKKSVDELQKELVFYQKEFVPGDGGGHQWRRLRIKNLKMEIALREQKEN